MPIEVNTIYNRDVLETMKEMDDKSVDLVVTDPPYLMNYQSGHRKVQFEKIAGDIDSRDLISQYIKECYRVLKDDTAIYIFCSWHNVDFFKQEVEKYFKLRNLIVWNKNNWGSGDLKGSYAPRHELILFAHKGRKLLNGKRISDVVNFDRVPGTQMKHPTQKPAGLLKIFIEKSSDPGDIVFDGFMGVGTTAAACIQAGRKYIGCELDKNYFDISIQRIDEENFNDNLFHQ